MISETHARQLSWEALGVTERMSIAGAESGPLKRDAIERYDRWKGHFATTHCPLGFERYVQRMGFTEVEAERAMKGTAPRETPIKDWVRDLAALLTGVADPENWEAEGSYFSRGASEEAAPCCDRLGAHSSALPFLDLWLRIGRVVEQELRARNVFEDDVLTPEAIGSAFGWLLQRLSNLGSSVLQLDFLRYVGERRPEYIVDDDAHEEATSSTEQYDSYISSLANGRLRQICLGSPQLSRHIVGTVKQWISAVTQFVEDLVADRAAIEDALPVADATAVADITPGKGDLHEGGKTVIEVEFSSGEKLVYKPRSVRAESTLRSLVGEVGRAIDAAFEYPRCLSRGDHGWVEHVEHEPLGDESPDAYYRKAGVVLALAYVLGSYDFHSENLIASGSTPVMIDGETLMKPTLPRSAFAEEQLAQAAINSYKNDSVLSTLLLPVSIRENEMLDDASVAGLTDVTQRDSTRALARWENINTDGMRMERRAVQQPATTNAPMKEGSTASPYPHSQSVVRGFRTGCEYLRSMSEEEERALLGELRDLTEIRFILRPTETYSATIDSLTAPSALNDGREFSIRLENLLSRVFRKVGTDTDGLTQLLTAERDAISELNVPRFTTRSDSTDLYFRGAVIVNDFFDESPINRARRRLHSLSEEEIQRQIGLIRHCLISPSGSDASENVGEQL